MKRVMPPVGISHVGFISPSGGNIGNAAILSSLIEAIRERNPEARITGFTLDPQYTARHHGIEAFPITSRAGSGYSVVAESPGAAASVLSRRGLSSLRKTLKAISPLRALFRFFRGVWAEVRHLVEAAQRVRTLDCLLVAGGGALDEFWGGPWGQPWTLLKFSTLSRIFGVPFLFMSIGKCSVRRPLSRRFIRSALRSAQYRSYRDHDSFANVQSIFRSPDDLVVPDLAYAFPLHRALDSRVLRWNQEHLVVAVSPIAWCDPRVWPEKDAARYRSYIERLSEVLRALIAQGHEILLFASDIPDYDNVRDLLEILSARGTDTRSIEVLPAPPGLPTETLLQALDRSDLVIASRLHGIILSHITATPALALSYDPKVETHMKEIGQSRYCLEIGQSGVAEILERFSELALGRAEETASLLERVRLCREQVCAQYDRVLGPASESWTAPAWPLQRVAAEEPKLQ